jgi:hypothetical protein
MEPPGRRFARHRPPLQFLARERIANTSTLRRRPPRPGPGPRDISWQIQTPAAQEPPGADATARERALKLELEGDISELFQKLTVKSYTWRENMRKKMEHRITGTDPRMIDQCLKYALGTPRKQRPVETGRRSRT